MRGPRCQKDQSEMLQGQVCAAKEVTTAIHACGLDCKQEWCATSNACDDAEQVLHSAV